MSGTLAVKVPHPSWLHEDFKCPKCGGRCEQAESDYDQEYGYFMLEDGTETLFVRCPYETCAVGFYVERTVKIKITFKHYFKPENL